MNVNQVNYLNIGLMLGSCAAAFVFPFQLFLFAYAVLGPLHYLTEISWLDQHGYYAGGRNRAWWLVGLCLLMFPGAILFSFLSPFSPPFLMLAFLVAYLFATQSRSPLFMSTLLAFFVFGVFIFWPAAQQLQIALAILLPTLIHVFLFTGIFILVGALKSKSRSGFFSLLVFFSCALSFFVLPSFAGMVAPSIQTMYVPFAVVNTFLLAHFAPTHAVDIFHSQAALGLMGFIAFAYTYHYLNWFSKTSVINWHRASRKRLIAILIGWILAVGVYVWNYQAGVFALLFLSLLHVILEFPLNHQSFKMLLGALWRG